MNNETVLYDVKKHIVDDYQTGDFFLASPNQTLLGKGIFSTVESRGEIGLAERVKSTLHDAKKKGHPHPIVIGAVPFEHSTQPHLVVPKEVMKDEPLRLKDNDKSEFDDNFTYEIEPLPQPENYMNDVKKGLQLIHEGMMSKIVLSRSLSITANETIDVPPLLKSLAGHNEQGYTFSIALPEESDVENRTLIGASPELLVSKSGSKIIANPLAGSRPRSLDPIEDELRANELLHSEKDLHEHAIVVDAVKSALQPYCKTLKVPSKPSLTKTETMWHLSTEITGVPKDIATSSFELASTLHPTPAICGHPTAIARKAIIEIEPFDRKFFTGMIGWCDENGDGEWIVTIRCAEVKDSNITLFAGAGVVAESQPQEELDETSAKFRTMLNAMGLEDY